MANRVPPDAFAYYLGLGPNRSYDAVADHFGVSKTAITNRAAKEDWQARVVEADRKARETSEARALESLEEMSGRHLKIVRAIQSRALEALRQIPIQTGMGAVRALETSVKLERLIRGEPNDRTEVTTEQIIRSEMDRWMKRGESSSPAAIEAEGETKGKEGNDNGRDDGAGQARPLS